MTCVLNKLHFVLRVSAHTGVLFVGFERNSRPQTQGAQPFSVPAKICLRRNPTRLATMRVTTQRTRPMYVNKLEPNTSNSFIHTTHYEQSTKTSVQRTPQMFVQSTILSLIALRGRGWRRLVEERRPGDRIGL